MLDFCKSLVTASSNATVSDLSMVIGQCKHFNLPNLLLVFQINLKSLEAYDIKLPSFFSMMSVNILQVKKLGIIQM